MSEFVGAPTSTLEMALVSHVSLINFNTSLLMNSSRSCTSVLLGSHLLEGKEKKTEEKGADLQVERASLLLLHCGRQGAILP